MKLEVFSLENTKVLISDQYSDSLFDFFEKKEEISAVYFKNPGIYVGKTPESYSDSIILALRKIYPENKMLWIFEVNGTPILFCDKTEDINFAKEKMKELKLEYLFDMENSALYFGGLLFNNKLVNTIRKKLNLKVISLHEV